MGLDVALGVIVLLTAIRGWMKGFVLQAIRLSGLVACVYLADPVRDLAKPHVLPHLPSIKPELVDRLLWWSSAVVSFIVLVGVATLIVNLSRRQTFGIAEPKRNDQFGGFFLGACKGLVVAMFLVAGLEKYALERVQKIDWARKQVASSKALKWNAKYEPVAKIWASPPVQNFVAQVRRGGLNSPEPPGVEDGSEAEADPKPLQAASSRPPRLLLPATAPWNFDTTGLEPELAGAVEAIKDELSRHGAGFRVAPAHPN